MNLLQKIQYKLHYWWNTFRIGDFTPSTIEVPFIDEDGEEQVSVVQVPGYIYKTFIHVVLTMRFNPMWTQDHMSALAEFLIRFPGMVDTQTLLAFLHPEFYETYDDEDDDLEIELESEDEQA